MSYFFYFAIICSFFPDIDECTENTHTCSDHATCNNMIRTYSCSCLNGFQGNGHNCTGWHQYISIISGFFFLFFYFKDNDIYMNTSW